MTPQRLQQVEHLQERLSGCAALAGILGEAEQNGWLPGAPQTDRVSHRAQPLEDLARSLADAAAMLERLYA